eukprot:TRINITY_DN251_c0_g1_i2.p1 TRINITY_DN251_c0_g1~~TRINITY_DN251_c0_g1_i2.p1  ORF type:complete len:194 (+),score=75.22 TRINITY_DN251_c0_g1_i2:58-639(+)
MKIYETPEGADMYTEMRGGADFSEHKDTLVKHIGDGSTLLELGMGPANDYAWMRNVFKVTGSDYSEVFLGRAKEKFPEGDFMLLNAKTMDTERRFDAIFSNKVYQHFDLPTTKIAMAAQAKVLNDHGTIAHTFWVGKDTVETHEGMTFYNHSKENLTAAIEEAGFTIVFTHDYNECENREDEFNSVFVIAKKN